VVISDVQVNGFEESEHWNTGNNLTVSIPYNRSKQDELYCIPTSLTDSQHN